MKRIIAMALSVLMLLTLFVGCGKNEALESAKAYLENMYQTGSKDEVMEMLLDTDVLSVVTVDGKSYDVEWSVEVTEGDKDSVKISESEKENHVLIDVPDVPETDVLFTATATIKDKKGNTESVSFNYKVTGIGATNTATFEEILNDAYALKENEKMEGTQTLTGKVTKIDTPYSKQYKNITVTITVDGFKDKPIVCYCLTGDGADTIAVGDYITVTGTIVNYKGTIEFDSGCVIKEVVKGDDAPSNTTGNQNSNSGSGTSSSSTTQTVTDVAKIMKDANALAHEATLSYTAVLTGKVIAIDTAYDSEFKNITVTIQVTGYDSTPIECYRLTGTGVEKIEKNDTITVSGTIQKYNKNIQFKSGCVMTKRISGGGVKQETDPANIMAAAYALKDGENLGYEVTLTGKVKSIETFYDATYGNISVWIVVANKDLLCYRMVGNDIQKINVGDTITVTGMIKNYGGKIEFDQGCTMRKREATGTAVTAPTDPKQIVDAAFALEPNASLPYSVTLTGKITEIATEYSSQYKNITVIIEVEGTSGKKELKCYRMKGDGAENLKVGDVITVTGRIKNYVHTSSGDSEVEFDAGCTFVK